MWLTGFLFLFLFQKYSHGLGLREVTAKWWSLSALNTLFVEQWRQWGQESLCTLVKKKKKKTDFFYLKDLLGDLHALE
jgi:hypothetical protein